MLVLMGACISQKNERHFSIDDLNGMEKYYSLLPKRKADVLRWMTGSEGPWKNTRFIHMSSVHRYKNESCENIE